MSVKSSRSSAEKGVLAAIILGISCYLIFAAIMYTNVKPTKTTYRSVEEVALMELTDTTYSNAGLPFKKQYLDDVARIDKDKEIILINDTSLSRDFYKKSRLFTNILFASNNESHLHFTISGLDLKYAKLLGKKNIPNPYFMNKNPKLALWILLISIAVGFSFFLSPLFYAEIQRYNTGLSKGIRRWNVFIALIIFILLVVPLFLPPFLFPGILFKPTDTAIFFDSGFSTTAIMLGATIPFACAIFWLILIFTVNSKVSQLFQMNSPKLITQFKEIKADVEKYFLAIAFFLAFTIFCTDTLLTTLNGLTINEPTLFPREFAFSNGLIQTFFLVLIYFGIQANFSRIKKEIYLDDAIKAEDKQQLKEHTSFFNYVKIVLTMLAPLLGSGIQDLIGLVAG